MANPGITLIKRFNYRGDPNEEFSNTYHSAADIPDQETFQNWVADLANAEANILLTEVSIIRAYGYKDTDQPANFTWDMTENPTDTVPGLFPPTGATITPGDTAYWARWDTMRKNSRGKAIYLRKYFHPGLIEAGSNDKLHSTLHAALLTYANALTGTLPNGFTMAGPSYPLDTGLVGASEYITTRTLKRRGKRP